LAPTNAETSPRKVRKCAPPAEPELAADQVHRLDVVGALVDREDLRVAAVLLDRMVLEVAGAAVDWIAVSQMRNGLVRGVGLDDAA
jgi:hypothetical protein